MSTKIHATVDALGNPTGFHLTGGQEHDLAGADALLPELEAETLIADKAFDADQRVLEPLAEAGKAAVVPPRKSRKTPRAFDKELYKARHLIENFFAKLKQFRAIATRYDKTARCFLAGIPWRDLPERFGDPETIHTRFSRWAKSGVWERVFNHLSDDADNEYAMIDSTIVRAHQHSAGARKKGVRIKPSGARAEG